MENAKTARLEKKPFLFSNRMVRKETSLLNKLSKIFSSTTEVQSRSQVYFRLQNLSAGNLDSYKIISRYNVNECKVYIVKDKSGKIVYLISEPPIDEKGKVIYSKIMHYLFVSFPSDFKNDKTTRILLKKRIIEISKKLGITKHVFPIIDNLLYYVIRDAVGYGIIDVPMRDPNLEDVVEENFSQPVGVVHKKFGEYGVLDTNIMFHSSEFANAFVQKLVQRTGKSMTAAVPYIDSMTKEGHRIAATFGNEVSLPGPNFTIRKFSKQPYTITRLIAMGTINPLMAAYCWLLLEAKAFLLVIGSTAAGKTTTIGALSSLINPQSKIITIEDTTELRLGHTHWQRMITRKSSSVFEDKYEVTMNELVKLSLRSRPDYIIVGEVRGEEISSLIQAVSTGHGGLTSFHAFDANSALVRMESPPMNVHLGGKMLISAILRQTRFIDANGQVSRKITEITEVIPGKDSIKLRKVMGWETTVQFYPWDVTELINNSERLKEISLINGWSREDLIAQLVTRACYLSRMVKRNQKDFDTVKDELEKFYYDPIEKHLALLDIKEFGQLC